MSKESIAISRKGEDYLRIIPKMKDGLQSEIVFKFMTKDFLIRSFIKNGQRSFNIESVYIDTPLDVDQITYHASGGHETPVVHTKSSVKVAGENQYKDLTTKVIDLDFRRIILPLPICRITLNKDSGLKYNAKNRHLQVEELFGDDRNTIDIYLAPKEYSFESCVNEWPNMFKMYQVGSIDVAIIGVGLSSKHFTQSLKKSTDLSMLYQIGDQVDKFTVIISGYKLDKTACPLYSDPIYETENVIEFFDTRDYLEALATSFIGKDESDMKLVFVRDYEHQINVNILKGLREVFYRQFCRAYEKYYPDHKSRFFITKIDDEIIQGASNGDINSMRIYATNLERIGEYMYASIYYKKLADQKDVFGIYNYARMILENHSHDTEDSLLAAIYLLKDLADRGYVPAMVSLYPICRDGIYYNGEIAYRNLFFYRRYLSLAAYKRFLPAIVEIYNCYSNGWYCFPKSNSLAFVYADAIMDLEKRKLLINVDDLDVLLVKAAYSYNESFPKEKALFIDEQIRRTYKRIENGIIATCEFYKYPWACLDL